MEREITLIGLKYLQGGLHIEWRTALCQLRGWNLGWWVEVIRRPNLIILMLKRCQNGVDCLLKEWFTHH